MVSWQPLGRAHAVSNANVAPRLLKSRLISAATSADNQETTSRSTSSRPEIMVELLSMQMKRLLIARGDAALLWDYPRGSLPTAWCVIQANLCVFLTLPSVAAFCRHVKKTEDGAANLCHKRLTLETQTA